MQETRFPQVIQKRLSPSNVVERLATFTTGYTPNPEREREEPSYYDFPVLKAPTWHWEITWYFFFGTYWLLSFAVISTTLSAAAHQRPGEA